MNDQDTSAQDPDVIILDVENLVKLVERPHTWDTTRIQLVNAPDTQPIGVTLSERVLRQVHDHAVAHTNEIGGVLIGAAYTHDGRVCVQLNEILRGNMQDSTPMHLTFSVNDWRAMFRQREALFPDQLVLGWYHSHPNMSVFFSMQDHFSHESYFRQAWHIALVVNGHHRLFNIYCWYDGELDLVRGLYLLREIGDANSIQLTWQDDHWQYAFE